MNKHEVIRKILDAATVDGRLETAIEALDEYAEDLAIRFYNWKKDNSYIANPDQQKELFRKFTNHDHK